MTRFDSVAEGYFCCWNPHRNLLWTHQDLQVIWYFSTAKLFIARSKQIDNQSEPINFSPSFPNGHSRSPWTPVIEEADNMCIAMEIEC